MSHNCDKVIEHIYEFINSHDLSGDIGSEIRGHLASCRDCYSRYEFELKLVERFKASSACLCPDSLKKKIKSIVDKF